MIDAAQDSNETRTNTHTHTHIHVHPCTSTRTHTHIHIHMHTRTYTHAHARTQTHMHTNAYTQAHTIHIHNLKKYIKNVQHTKAECWYLRVGVRMELGVRSGVTSGVCFSPRGHVLTQVQGKVRASKRRGQQYGVVFYKKELCAVENSTSSCAHLKTVCE